MARSAPAAPRIFPDRNHDHARCESDAMAMAEAICAKGGDRLTPMRRRVLGVLLASHKPLGAYDIMDRLAADAAPRPAPITVYRALDFLRDKGLVHRIESRNSFIACVHNHGEADLVVFLICDHCGEVGEAAGAQVAAALGAAAGQAGFALKTPVVEIGGVCAHCGSTDTGPSGG